MRDADFIEIDAAAAIHAPIVLKVVCRCTGTADVRVHSHIVGARRARLDADALPARCQRLTENVAGYREVKLDWIGAVPPSRASAIDTASGHLLDRVVRDRSRQGAAIRRWIDRGVAVGDDADRVLVAGRPGAGNSRRTDRVVVDYRGERSGPPILMLIGVSTALLIELLEMFALPVPSQPTPV